MSAGRSAARKPYAGLFVVANSLIHTTPAYLHIYRTLPSLPCFIVFVRYVYGMEDASQTRHTVTALVAKHTPATQATQHARQSMHQCRAHSITRTSRTACQAVNASVQDSCNLGTAQAVLLWCTASHMPHTCSVSHMHCTGGASVVHCVTHASHMHCVTHASHMHCITHASHMHCVTHALHHTCIEQVVLLWCTASHTLQLWDAW